MKLFVIAILSTTGIVGYILYQSGLVERPLNKQEIGKDHVIQESEQSLISMSPNKSSLTAVFLSKTKFPYFSSTVDGLLDSRFGGSMIFGPEANTMLLVSLTRTGKDRQRLSLSCTFDNENDYRSLYDFDLDGVWDYETLRNKQTNKVAIRFFLTNEWTDATEGCTPVDEIPKIKKEDQTYLFQDGRWIIQGEGEKKEQRKS